MRRITALALLFAMSIPGVPTAEVVQPGSCSVFARAYVGCDDNKHKDGKDPDNKRRHKTNNNDEDVYVPPKRRSREECAENWQNMRFCFEKQNDNEDVDEPREPRTPDFDISDVAIFAPDPTPVIGEPDNVGVAGLPTNFVAQASVQVKNGDLLGLPVSVRFTPVSYTFTYGDGKTLTSKTGGTSWADLAQAQFTATPTAHTYAQRGTYDAQVDVAYTAEVGLGGAWYPLAGQITIDGTSQQVRIYEAKTALVDRTCQEQPSAPGC